MRFVFIVASCARLLQTVGHTESRHKESFTLVQHFLFAPSFTSSIIPSDHPSAPHLNSINRCQMLSPTLCNPVPHSILWIYCRPETIYFSFKRVLLKVFCCNLLLMVLMLSKSITWLKTYISVKCRNTFIFQLINKCVNDVYKTNYIYISFIFNVYLFNVCTFTCARSKH